MTITRKNSLFAGSDAGARHWAIANTLIQTCKLNDVEPLAWLTDVLQRIISGRNTTHQPAWRAIAVELAFANHRQDSVVAAPTVYLDTSSPSQSMRSWWHGAAYRPRWPAISGRADRGAGPRCYGDKERYNSLEMAAAGTPTPHYWICT
jgi:hypothetical protein